MERVPMVITTKFTVREAAQRSQGDVAIPTLHPEPKTSTPILGFE
jgi:hypothetical protein